MPTRRCLALFLSLFIASFSFAQKQELEYENSISVSQLFQRIQQAPGDTAYISNLNIVADPATDSRYLTDVRGEENWDSISANFDSIIIDKTVFIYNVHFAQRTVLPKIHFKGMLHLEGISVYGDLFFRGCEFDYIQYGHIMDAYFFGFDRCKFLNGLNWEKMQPVNFSLDNCTVKGHVFSMYNVDEPLMMTVRQTRFETDQVFVYSEKQGKATFYKCRFENPKARVGFLVGNNATLSALELIRDTFNMPATFNDLSIKELFQVNHCQFNNRVALKGVNIPEGNTSLPWPQLAGNKLTQQFSRDSFFNGKMAYAAKYDDAYLDLLKNYSQLLRAYKNNGDSDSYNACYTEMKDMATRKAAFHFRQNPNTSTFFTLYLNRFLKVFCDYGTNPVKALIFSMYVILSFGLLYFLFPSDGTALWQPPGWRFWRKTERQAWMSEIRNRLTMSKLRRGLVQFVNAVALSMNAFVTLGYGDMPARGVARYLAVLEGLMGWFLLSIFSASLISQILQ